MSKVTIVGSVTYAIDIDLPLGFLVDEKQLAREQTRQLKAQLRGSIPDNSKLRDVQATTIVVAERPW
ncbi:hypothetical protein ACIPX0_26280 [Streptomyces sp. NPDC090075]|uniref:hypothetical protein n=1 Tax=Streptomyces sp. NPDC090075 TaxID=3365937 RepID=UPI0037F52ED4